MLLNIGPINSYVANVRNLRAEDERKSQALQSMKTILGNTRSPGLCENEGDHLTEKLLA